MHKKIGLVGCVLIIAGAALSLLGTEHEISKIPAAHRARMSDTDWVGVEWVARGAAVALLGVVCVGVSGALFYRKSHRRG